MRIFVTLLILAALSTGGFFGYKKWLAEPAEVRYTTVELKRSTVVSVVTATGTIEPLVKVLVGSQVSGTVVNWYADFNQEVEKDFVLAELDQERYKASLAQRNAAVLIAKAQAEESAAKLGVATLERKQIEDAFNRSAASDFELQTVKATEAAAVATLHASEAQIASAEADRDLAKIELDKTIIRAPISGVVISRDIDAGQTVAASLSAPTLFTIANDLQKMRVNAAVGETDIGKVREGMSAEFRVDAYPERRFRGKVAQVRYNQTVVDNVVTYTTLIDVDNPDLALRPGMTATIMFEVDKAEDVLAVPNAALRFNPRSGKEAETDWTRPGRVQAIKPRVFRLVENKLVEISLELGINDGSVTQVRAGDVKPGDRVVVEQENPGGGGGQRPMQQRVPRSM